MITVEIRRLDSAQDLPLPFYATIGSAGMDLCSIKDMTLLPGERAVVPTGYEIALPAGYEAQIRSRSGMTFKHGIVVLNAPGTIDSDYRGEIGVIVMNVSQEPFDITRGMRIAQMVVAPYTRVAWQESQELSATDRQDGGFGSTGTHQAA